MFKKYGSFLILSLIVIGCSKSINEETIVASKPKIEGMIIPSSKSTKQPVLFVTGPIYTTFELNSKYETVPRDKPVWVIGYIISEPSSISGIFKICSLNAFTTNPEKLNNTFANYQRLS